MGAAVQEEMAQLKAEGSLADPEDLLDLQQQAHELQASLASMQFKHIDVNSDGVIQREEWIAKYGSNEGFDKWDLNSDGVIDREEFLAMQRADAQAFYEQQRDLAQEQLEAALTSVREEISAVRSS